MNETPPTLLPLDAPAARAFDALVDYFAYLYANHLLPSTLDVKADVVALGSHRTAASAARAWNLGRMLAARAAGDTAVGEEEALTLEAQAMRDEAEKAVESFHAFIRLPNWLRKKHPSAERCRENAAGFLRHVALEERDIDFVINGGPSGKQVAIATPMGPITATVASFLHLLEMIDLQFDRDWLVRLEGRAAEWWFDTWSPAPRDDYEEMQQEIRRWEFTVLDRRMLSLEHETLAAAAAIRIPETALSPRQRSLLDQSSRSVCGCFLVRQRRTHTALFEDLETGDSYEIQAYKAAEEYEEGCLVVGRLIPTDLGWIRSVGSTVWSPDDGLRASLAESLRETEITTYRSVKVEVALGAMRGELPRRRVRPALDAEDAQYLLEEYNEQILDGDLPHLAPSIRRVRMESDVVFGQWLDALREQVAEDARPRRWGADHEAAQREHDRRKNSRRRR